MEFFSLSHLNAILSSPPMHKEDNKDSKFPRFFSKNLQMHHNKTTRTMGAFHPTIGLKETTPALGEQGSNEIHIHTCKKHKHHITKLQKIPSQGYFTKAHHWNLEHRVKVETQGGLPFHIIFSIKLMPFWG